MDCGDDADASSVLERYGYYRLSGYWYPNRARPKPPAPRLDPDGREIRLDSFEPGTSLARVVSLYEFDHELRNRVGDTISMIETAFRFLVGHRLGRVDTFAHRKPEVLGTVRRAEPCAPLPPAATPHHQTHIPAANPTTATRGGRGATLWCTFVRSTVRTCRSGLRPR